MSQFTASCLAKNHNRDLEGADNLVEIFPNRRKGVPVSSVEWFFSSGEIDEKRRSNKLRKVHVCKPCLSRAIEGTAVKEEENRVDIPAIVKLISCISKVEDAKVVQQAVMDKLESLKKIDKKCSGPIDLETQLAIKCIGSRIRNEFCSVSKPTMEQRIQMLKTSTYEQFWNDEPPVWKALLMKITVGSQVSEKTTRFLVKAGDCVRLLLDQNYISPLAHAEAMMILQYSHSRLATDIYSHAQASGSYSTIKRTIESLAASEKPVGLGDMILGFDNNQIIQKTWSIKLKGKQKSTIITSLVLFQNVQFQDFQTRITLPTSLELCGDINVNTLLKRYEVFRTEADTCMNVVIKNFLDKRFRAFKRDSVEPAPMNNLEECVIGGLTYDIVKKGESTYTVVDLSCLPVNPASYASVKQILDEILLIKQKDKNRKWILVYMDGSPHGLACKLIKTTFLCSVCNSEVSNLDDHLESTHMDTGEKSKVKLIRKYEGIIVRPGAGHMEMLILKSILHTFWEPFILPVAMAMGYKTKPALEYCRKGGDHHKSWELLMVVLTSLLEELISTYTEVEAENKRNAQGFLNFAKLRCSQNVTYKLSFNFVFEVLIPLFVYRSAIRQSNDEVALQARDIATRLLYGSSHPKYHNILTYDTFYILSLPENLRCHVSKESCRTVKSNVGQGFDFVVEERNKLQKSYLPADGAPNFSQWKNVIDSMHELEKIKDLTSKRLGISIHESVQRKRDLCLEIEEATAYFRDNLGLRIPCKEKLLSSELLEMHESFAEFSKLCNKNQLAYFDSFLRNTLTHLPTINNAIFPEKLESMSHEQIFANSKTLIQTLEEPAFSLFRNSFKSKMSTDELKNLYTAILRQIEIQENLEGAYN